MQHCVFRVCQNRSGNVDVQEVHGVVLLDVLDLEGRRFETVPEDLAVPANYLIVHVPLVSVGKLDVVRKLYERDDDVRLNQWKSPGPDDTLGGQQGFNSFFKAVDLAAFEVIVNCSQVSVDRALHLCDLFGLPILKQFDQVVECFSLETS